MAIHGTDAFHITLYSWPAWGTGCVPEAGEKPEKGHFLLMYLKQHLQNKFSSNAMYWRALPVAILTNPCLGCPWTASHVLARYPGCAL